MKKNRAFIYCTLLLTLPFFASCDKKTCDFDSSIFENDKNIFFKPNLKLTTHDCEVFYLKGKINYYLDIYEIELPLYRDEYILYNEKNKVVFDFSSKKNGSIQLSNSKLITVEHLTNIKDDSGNEYSLFELSNINNYYGENLNLIIVCSMDFGIVGEFLSDYSNKYLFNYRGYVGVKPMIDKLFIEKKLR